jgi:hypothetical protein
MGILIACVLAGATFAVVRWLERTLGPATRYEDFVDQIAPLVQDFNAVSLSMPTTEALLSETENSQRTQLSGTLQTLLARSTANRVGFRRVATPDPELQELCRTLEAGNAAQIATIQASQDYLATSNPNAINGAAGVKAGRARIGHATREFEEQQRAFLRRNGLDSR